MVLKYIIEEQDFLDYHLFDASKSKQFKKSKKRSFILMFVLFLILGANFYNKMNLNYTIYFGIFAVIWLLFFNKYFKWKLRKHYKRFVKENYTNRFGTISTVEINQEFILTKDKIGEGKINISEIEVVNETKNHFFTKISSGSSLIMPKRNIDDSEQMKSMFDSLSIPIKNEMNWKW